MATNQSLTRPTQADKPAIILSTHAALCPLCQQRPAWHATGTCGPCAAAFRSDVNTGERVMAEQGR